MELKPSEYDSYKLATKPNQPVYKNLAIAAPVAAVVLIIISFYGGVAYQKGKTPASNNTANTASASSRFGSGMGGPGSGGFSRGNRAFGTVSSVSDTSITVATRTGSNATYTLTGSTTVTDSGTASTVSAIQNGDTVVLTLSSTDSKTVTAIMLNPSFGGGPSMDNGNTGSGTSDSGASATSTNAQST